MKLSISALFLTACNDNNDDFKQIFTSGAADIADLAYGRTAMLVPA